MKKEDLLNKIKETIKLNESVSVASTLGVPGSPTYGGFIGPLSMINKKKLNSRLFYTWADKNVKNSDGVGTVVEPPQGYVSEHIYNAEGGMVTEGDLIEWFGGDLKQGTAFNGGKIVSIEPKCMAFPYCSQGATDKPIKLIGETKEDMCDSCYDYCKHIGDQSDNTPEHIAKLIRENYLGEAKELGLDEESKENVKELDESIELKDTLIEESKDINNNILENTDKMENVKLTAEMASKCMESIMENKELAECMYETLIKEGFLPETIEEGETYESECKNMMEDSDICLEMVKSCMTSVDESECTNEMQGYITEYCKGTSEGPIEDNAKAVINEKGEDRYTFFGNLEQMRRQSDILLALDESKIQELLDNGHDWAQDHIATSKESMDQVFDFIMNEMETPETTEPEMDKMDLEELSPSDIVNSMREENEEVSVKSDSQQYETELRQFNQFMNTVEGNLNTVGKILSPDTIKDMFNNYFRGFESSKEANADEFIDFIQKGGEENHLEYYDRIFSKGPNQSILMLLTSPAKRGFLDKSGLDREDKLLDALDSLDSLESRISKKRNFISDYMDRKDSKEMDKSDTDTDFSDEKEPSMKDLKNIEKMGNLDIDSDEDFLSEAELAKFTPIKGKFVDSENDTNSKKENTEGIEDAEDSQESTEEKVDDLKNQKFSPNMETESEKEAKESSLGYKNALNLDYDNEPSEEYKDRVEMEVKTGHSLKRDEKTLGAEANIDNESEAGEKIWDASKENQENADKDYTSKPVSVEDEEEKEGSNKINEELDKMKKMFSYDQSVIDVERKTRLVNENDIFITNVSKKKML